MLVEYILTKDGHVARALSGVLSAEVDSIPDDIDSGTYKLEGRTFVKDDAVVTHAELIASVAALTTTTGTLGTDVEALEGRVVASQADVAAEAVAADIVVAVNALYAAMRTAGLMAAAG